MAQGKSPAAATGIEGGQGVAQVRPFIMKQIDPATAASD
jgi:hypothetical protein